MARWLGYLPPSLQASHGQSKFNPWNPHNGQMEPTPSSCPAHICADVHTYTYTQINKKKLVTNSITIILYVLSHF